eukprot:8373125-Lingulodinium_polyedra.AAC.1
MCIRDRDVATRALSVEGGREQGEDVAEEDGEGGLDFRAVAGNGWPHVNACCATPRQQYARLSWQW